MIQVIALPWEKFPDSVKELLLKELFEIKVIGIHLYTNKMIPVLCPFTDDFLTVRNFALFPGDEHNPPGILFKSNSEGLNAYFKLHPEHLDLANASC